MGNCQGVETPRPLVSAKKGAQQRKKHQKTPRDGAAQEQVRRKHAGGGQEARDWKHDPPSGPAGTGPAVEAGRGGGGGSLRDGGGRK